MKQSLALLVAYFLSFNVATVAAGNGVAGLTERLFTLEAHAWYVVMGWLAWRRAQRPANFCQASSQLIHNLRLSWFLIVRA